MLADAINGLFELLSAGFCLLNIRQLLRDKRLRGVHWAPTCFFTLWGLWNLFYYPSLDQWLSFVGGCAITLANAAWLLLIWRYRRN